MSKIKVIHEIHDMWPATLIEIGGMPWYNPFVWVLQRAENSAYKRSDGVVSILPYAEGYMRQHGLSEGKFVHIPNGVVREDWENAMDIPDEMKRAFDDLKGQGKFITGYFGGHALSNSLNTLIDAAKLCLDREDMVFVFVGKGVEKERIMKRCEDEGISNVVFMDPVNKMAVPNLVAQFDCIYVATMDSPLYRFGFGLNKFFDAMMAAKPLVLAATAPETILEQYDCGMVVPSGDASAMKDALIKVYDMGEEGRAAMGKRGKDAIEAHFMYDKLASDFEKVMFDEELMPGEEKRILIINHYAGSPEMGMEFRPYYLGREWIKKGYRVDILAADFSHLRTVNPAIDHDNQEEIIDGIHYHWFKSKEYEGNGVKRALTMFSFVWKLWKNARKLAEEIQPDAVINSSTYPLDTFAGRRIRKMAEKFKK